ncbi:MAG: radical SAM protein [Thermodesulfobacteriota bacterium]
MKYTFCITQECNLRCSYCYISKKNNVMTLQIAKSIIDNIFEYTPNDEKIDIGFFGGEPLLEFKLIKQIVSLIKNHSLYNPTQIELDIVTNGTIFSDEIGRYLADNNITYCLSCDGPTNIQNEFRKFKCGKGSSIEVEKTITQAKKFFPTLLVNAVYQPSTLHLLPQVVQYFSALGISQIYLSPDFSSKWTEKEVDLLSYVFDQIGEQYIDFYLKGNPHYISPIDNKIAVIIKDGYTPSDRCRMGRGEFAFAPSGNIYPCERLIGSDNGEAHCIGNIFNGIPNARSCKKSMPSQNNKLKNVCTLCSLEKFCMNWCGCSNFFSSGNYYEPGAFLCASEKAAINTSFNIFRALTRDLGVNFIEQMANCATSGNILQKNI